MSTTNVLFGLSGLNLHFCLYIACELSYAHIIASSCRESLHLLYEDADSEAGESDLDLHLLGTGDADGVPAPPAAAARASAVLG